MAAENTGRLTAVRQWLQELLIMAEPENLPEHPEVDLSMVGEAHPFFARYRKELTDSGDQRGEMLIFSHERAREGFDEGVRLMKDAGEGIFEYAGDVVAALLRAPGMAACQIKALEDFGLLGLAQVRASIIKQVCA